ncbi:MAG: HAD-IG family 5'-nucleotidase [Nannocystaceae bacterium]
MSEEISELVLEALGGEAVEPPKAQRIFTNRDLDFESIEAIGFDMDYTLAVYKQAAMEQLSLDATVTKLLAQGYPEELSSLQVDLDFAMRGLIVDKQEGNLLKLDRHGYVGRAFHGHRRMAGAERTAMYSAQRIGQDPERFAWADTLFALPEITIFAKVVDLIDSAPERSVPTYGEAWNDVRAAIDLAHQDDSIKREIKQRPGDYLEDDPDLPATLHKLRSSGKKLFLLTNSYFPYSNVLMSHLLDRRLPEYESWRSFFDWIVVGSKKPSFFEAGRPFLGIDPESGELTRESVEVPLRGRVYQGGAREGLQRALGMSGDAVLYVGDHIYGDIVKSKKSSSWRTALVLSDLEHDLAVRDRYRSALEEIESLTRLRNQLAEQSGDQRNLLRQIDKLGAEDLNAVVGEGVLSADECEALLEKGVQAARRRHDRLKRHHERVYDRLQEVRKEVGRAFNPYWGSVFAERYDTSLFGAQVESYACIYTSRVSNFRYVSPARKFHAPHGSLPHW